MNSTTGKEIDSMQRRLFFLRHDGWFEVEISGKLLHTTDTELLQWVYKVTEISGYRNYMVSENPQTESPVLKTP